MTENIHSKRLAQLRAALKSADLDGMIVPRSDAHQSEYVAPSDERLKYICGFSGSAGTAVVAPATAALFTDGRYTIQANNQLCKEDWQVRHSMRENILDWFTDEMPDGGKVGFDERLHRAIDIARMKVDWAAKGLELVPLQGNPIDELWTDQPDPPNGPVEIFGEALAGEGRDAKIARVADRLGRDGLDGLVISAPDSLAWVLNIRGSDIDMVPVAFGYGVLSAKGTLKLYMRPEKLVDALGELSASGKVAVAQDETPDFANSAGQKLRFDGATASAHLVDRARAAGVEVDLGPDPIQLMKACKNPVEIAGMRSAHDRDGLAVVKFLRWFAEERPVNANEWDASEQLESYRKGLNLYRGPSFTTISAAGPSAAQAHYSATAQTAAPIRDGQIYLSDSGGQYLDGTTDITRVTVAGTPTDEMRMRYTQVLRGHMALLRQRFPEGLDGAQLDSIARQHLWHEGVDFDHGTGHGIGHYLSVHEGPQSISKRGKGVALQAGMILSVEPGYYKPDAFGIRIENLAVVQAVADPPELADLPMLEFDILTYVPYERALIDRRFLRDDEVDWIDRYHATTRQKLSGGLDGADLEFLIRMTEPI